MQISHGIYYFISCPDDCHHAAFTNHTVLHTRSLDDSTMRMMHNNLLPSLSAHNSVLEQCRVTAYTNTMPGH